MAAGIFFLFILLLIIAAWTDLKEGYIPDSVSILIFLLSFYSLFIRSGPGLLLRIEGAVLCGFWKGSVLSAAAVLVWVM